LVWDDDFCVVVPVEVVFFVVVPVLDAAAEDELFTVPFIFKLSRIAAY